MTYYPKEILVFLDCAEKETILSGSSPHPDHQHYEASTNPPAFIGILRFESIHGKEISSFEYDKVWLADNTLDLDPYLYPFLGRQYPNEGMSTFGIFEDSCPDRWGRTLMLRKEARLSKLEGRSARTLMTSDFLLGVDDFTRMGALRYMDSETKDFLAVGNADSVPPLTSLRTLEAAAHSLEEASSSHDAFEALDILLFPGSSLGGARPKANIRDEAGHLWIAKFPSQNDSFDVGLIEAFTHSLAEKFGIEVPIAMKGEFSPHGTTFLSKRFDRRGSTRLLFSSAMTQLGLNENSPNRSEVGYLDLAEFIKSKSEKPRDDLRQLFRRIVFSLAISNTDDHLRNHGFLYGKRGWKLSPAYDLNPNPNGSTLSLNIDGNDSSLYFVNALNVASYFETNNSEASHIVDEAILLLKDWAKQARRFGIKASDIELLSPAFDTGKKL